ncbi:MAG TPA: methyltransferase domain-containing protein [Lysobacter sp.]
MAQYQSFPGVDGDSRTFDKLRALCLPDLAGRRFLDVGCNEGFFCGFASFQGAERVVGVDHSRAFIERARARFPGCEFHLQGWETLPEGPFDVILLASSLHYADDQPALIRRLVDRLSPDGVLVLELGIVALAKSEWVKVQRGIDERHFPTMAMVRETLADYAWKWMGPSVSQDGDPVPRHVVHISRRRPVAYLLLQPPGYGKTSIASGLFGRAGVPTVSGDELILRVANGQEDAPPALRELLSADFSPFRIDQSIRKVFDAGLGGELVALWQREAGDGSFALDAYVPEEHQAFVESLMAQAGYLPVFLRWEPVGMRPLAAEVAAQQAEAYFFSLAEPDAGASAATDKSAYAGGALGYVDDFIVAGDRATLRGWAVDATGAPARCFGIRLGGQFHTVSTFERQARPDVQQHLRLPHSLFGYRVSLPVPAGSNMEKLLESLEVRAGDAENRLGPALPFAEPLQRAK